MNTTKDLCLRTAYGKEVRSHAYYDISSFIIFGEHGNKTTFHFKFNAYNHSILHNISTSNLYQHNHLHLTTTHANIFQGVEGGKQGKSITYKHILLSNYVIELRSEFGTKYLPTFPSAATEFRELSERRNVIIKMADDDDVVMFGRFFHNK